MPTSISAQRAILRQAETFACNEDFLTYTGLKEFKDFLDESPKHAAEYLSLASSTSSLDPSTPAYTTAHTRLRCWVRLRLEEWMESEDGEFDSKAVDKFFKGEQATPGQKAQFEANKEGCLTEEGITTLWVVFGLEEGRAREYIRMCRGMGVWGRERVLERVEYIKSLFEEYIQNPNSPEFAEEDTTDIYFDQDEIMEYKIKDKAIKLGQREEFLTKEGLEDFSTLLWDEDEEIAEDYISLVNKHVRREHFDYNVAERALFVRELLTTWLKDNSYDAEKIFTYFNDAANAPHRPEIAKACELLARETQRTGGRFDTYLKSDAYRRFLAMLQGSRDLSVRYTRMVEEGGWSMVERIDWLEEKWERLNPESEEEL